MAESEDPCAEIEQIGMINAAKAMAAQRFSTASRVAEYP